MPKKQSPNAIASYFNRHGLLSEDAASAHEKEAKREGLTLITYLVVNKIIKSSVIASIVSIEMGIPFLDLDAVDRKALPLELVDEKLIRQYRFIPLFTRGKFLFIAMSDPTNFIALSDIKFHTGLSIEIILVEEDKLSIQIEKILDEAAADLADYSLDESSEAETGVDDDDTVNADEAPIVKYVKKILLDAIKQGASDIHIELFEKSFRVRYRTDGMLRLVTNPPMHMAGRIVSRIKVMSKMDIAERRIPQDGRIKLILSKNKAIDFRVNTCPTLFGEKIVMRILDPTSAQLGIEKLGFEPQQQVLFLEAIHKPYGLVLVTGPTGSGKTVSLYTGLNILNSIERNISTAEDPVEITVEGINQVNMNVKAGLTFATALRAFLRQDPDIIMVGEIRDLETAEIAVKAAQTGHLVLSTLHTNDAPQTLNRLMQMGIPPYNIVASVNLIMAQRLARRLCEHCKVIVKFPEETLLSAGFKAEELNDLKIYRPIGCEHCTKGYKGRVGIYQVMTLSEKMRALILTGGNSMQMAEQATSEGINDLRASGLNKVRLGVTSLEEIDRVTKE